MKIGIEGGERSVIPASIDIIRRTEYLAFEIHDGFSSELIPYMQDLGFGLSRIERKEYLLKAIKQVFLHPIDSYKLWRVFKGTGENLGLRKISTGIDISNSQDLVLGLFFKSSKDA